MVCRRGMTKTAVALKKLEREPLTSHTARAVFIRVAHTPEIWDKTIRLVEITNTFGRYRGVLR
jgi:hypothetical protein